MKYYVVTLNLILGEIEKIMPHLISAKNEDAAERCQALQENGDRQDKVQETGPPSYLDEEKLQTQTQFAEEWVVERPRSEARTRPFALQIGLQRSGEENYATSS